MDLIILGAIFLVGLMADVLGRLTPMPRVTVLLLSGVLIGPMVLGVISDNYLDSWFPFLTHVALAMIGFLMGQKLALPALKENGLHILCIAAFKVCGAALFVGAAVYWLTEDWPMTLILAGVATATAPAATFDVVQEFSALNHSAPSRFIDTLISIVALDDALALILFSLLLALAVPLSGAASTSVSYVAGLNEVVGSIALGAVLGIPMAYLTGRINFDLNIGEPIQAETYAFVLLVAGIAIEFDLSPILASMSMGAVVASSASHHKRPFEAISGIEWPFLILFFVLAGASFTWSGTGALTALVIVYIAFRGIGTYVGSALGATIAREDHQTRTWIGLTLLPQAGVALGMTLLATQALPAYADRIVPVVLASTIILELISPMFTRRILAHLAALREGSS